MLSLFKKAKKVVRDTVTNRIPVTAKQIHEDFYAESSDLLNHAVENEEELIERRNQLSAAGFYNTAEYKTSSAAADKKFNRETAIYYSNKYPNYKFITQRQVEKLCKKYGLLLANTHNYIGSIPSANLAEISACKIDMHDYDCISNEGYRESIKQFTLNHGEEKLNELINAKGEPVKIGEYESHHGHTHSCYASLDEMNIACFFIVAQPHDFNKDNAEIISGYKLVDKDPIVFFKVNGGYLILSAWGDETNIPEIVNEKMN